MTEPRPASGFDTPAQMQARLTELEIKAAYAEDLLDTLNMTVARQQDQIEWLLREVRRLSEQSTDSQGAGTFRSLRDELPPHY